MRDLVLIKHFKGAPGLRFFGIGPHFLPCKGLYKLKTLLDQNTSWAKNRKIKDLRTCINMI